MKAFTYIGTTLAIYLLANIDMLMTPITAIFGGLLSVLLIGLGIAQAVSVLVLIKPKSSTVATAAEMTLLISSLILIMNGQFLFVTSNLVLMCISKLVFTKNKEATTVHSTYSKPKMA